MFPPTETNFDPAALFGTNVHQPRLPVVREVFNPVRGEANVSKLRYPLLLLDTLTQSGPYPFVSPSSLGQSGQKGVAEEQPGSSMVCMVAEVRRVEIKSEYAQKTLKLL